jgi:hypothetical protein
MASVYESAILDPIFMPAVRDIAAITNSNPLVVTTTFAHTYATGLILRLIIPSAYGMQQANRLKAAITVTGPTTFTMPIDSTSFDTFVVPTLLMGQPEITIAQSTPVGEVASILTESFVNILTPQF